MPDFPQQIEVKDDSINPETGLSDEVSIMIDDRPYKFWTDVNINLSLDNLADTFSISGPFDYENFNFRELFRPYKYKEVALYIAGERILQGTLLTPKPTSSANAVTITLDGYSGNGIIADVNVSPVDWPIQINGLNLQEIAEKLLDPFGLTVIFDVDPGAKFSKSDKVRMEPDEKIGEFLIKLAKQRGIIISSNEDNELVFHKVTTEPPTITIQGGEWPWIGSSPTYNGQNMFSEITALGTSNKKGAGGKATIENPLLEDTPRKRPLVFRASDISQGGLKEAAQAQLGRMLAGSVEIPISVIGWHRPDKKLWKDNTKINYVNPRDMLYQETEYIIRNVNFKKTFNSLTTDLTLIFPESYSGEIRKSFPWQE